MWKPTFKIDQFELGPSLGRGTVGEIYLAKLRDSGQQVAIKILQPSFSQNQLVRLRFEREIAILEKLRHPNIIEVYGGGRMGDQLFFAMEYIDSGSVKDLLLRFDVLTWPEAATIGKQVCSALQYAHNHGIIHRDLKPANLFLKKDGSVKLGDFGIARDLNEQDLSEQGMTVGTHAYMSPEQIVGSETLDGKSDLYSLGCVLYEILVGKPPFQAPNFAALFDQHLKQAPRHVRETRSDIPPLLDTVINQLLAKSPESRPFNARTVQGIMIELLEASANPNSANAPEDTVPAIDFGQQHLSRRLRASEASQTGSWKTIAIVASLIVLVVVVSMLVRNG